MVLIIVLALAGGAGYYYLHTADRGRIEITPARQTEGGREVTRQVEYYDLDMILSIGFRTAEDDRP